MNKSQVFLELLMNESPKLIDVENIEKDTRKELYTELHKDKRLIKLYPPYPGADLVRVGQKFAVLDNNIREITYFMKWDYKKVKGMRVVYQPYVWRSRDYPQNIGIPLKVFFDYLFPITGKVATDRLHTDMGKGFWQHAVEIAFNKYLYVYLVDLINKDTLVQIKNNDELASVSKDIWGNSKKYETRVLLISKDPI